MTARSAQVTEPERVPASRVWNAMRENERAEVFEVLRKHGAPWFAAAESVLREALTGRDA